jgi:phospholipid/cholesterol/gamma-HCH transport system permease protein
MRISDEISALESVGIDPMKYVIATRFTGAMLAIPLIYFISIIAGTAGSFVVVVYQIGEVSSAGWSAVHWGYQTLSESFYGFIKAGLMGVSIVLVSMYYGFRARGGPVGVGAATARSMIVNLVLIHLIGMGGSSVFWGTSARTPIGG